MISGLYDLQSRPKDGDYVSVPFCWWLERCTEVRSGQGRENIELLKCTKHKAGVSDKLPGSALNWLIRTTLDSIVVPYGLPHLVLYLTRPDG